MKLRRLALFLVVMCVHVLTSCGKESTYEIDTVPPNPPVGLSAVEWEGMALITWAPNPEIDLAGYRLYKSSYEEGPFGLVNRHTLIADTCCYDRVTPNWMTYYRVTAVDMNGNESAYSQVVGIYWNEGGGGRGGAVTPDE